MKQIISISLGPSKNDYEFKTEFLGQEFRIMRLGVNGEMEKAAQLLLKWDKKADAIGIGDVKFPYAIGSVSPLRSHADKLNQLAERIETPVTTGVALRNVSAEWALRFLDHKYGDYFKNTTAFFVSGMTSYRVAKVMSEYTSNLIFADPVLKNGISKFIKTLSGLEKYASGLHEMLNWIPSKRITSSAMPLKAWNDYIYRKAMQKANTIVVPYNGFYKYFENTTLEELGGKTVITATAYDDRVDFLKERGVEVIIDVTPKILEKVVGPDVLEALIIGALDVKNNSLGGDDLLEVISSQKMDPRIIFPAGCEKRVNRFAFVIHPLSQEFLKKDKTIDFLSGVTPPSFLDVVEKVIAYAPPMIYSKVTGIKSPTGVEAEGWLITVGGTPKQMLAHSPEFTYTRLLQAARMSKRMGAQIMGLGAFTKVVGDAGVTVAKKAELPVTTGNSYSASGALWAASDAVRRMNLLDVSKKGGKIKGKAMVLGATGAIGSVCCRLLAMAFDELYMAGRNTAKLLALQQSILEETPSVKIRITTNPNKFLEDMDVIVTATSGVGKKILDITRVKPGCVITDVARPLDLSPEEVKKRPDVLVIESGEIELPGNPEMKNIGLPHKVVYACLAETIVLTLEGRYEVFTIGRDIEWQKVKDIYKMGLKHGMKLATISGVNGVFSDEDIANVRALAIKARQRKNRSISKKRISQNSGLNKKNKSGDLDSDFEKSGSKSQGLNSEAEGARRIAKILAATKKKSVK